MQEPEKRADGWLQQNNLIQVGLIAVGLVLVQPLLAAESLDVTAVICVVSFAVAIPLLAFLSMLGQLQVLHDRVVDSRVFGTVKAVAFLAASVGVVAAFWHVAWFAGVAVLVSGLVGLTVYGGYSWRLTR